MIFDELKDEYVLEKVPYIGKVELVRCKGRNGQKFSWGNGILKNHKWYAYHIKCDGKFPFGYSQLVMMPHMVTEEMRHIVKDAVIESGVTFETTPTSLPHIDGNTGNIHAEDYNVEDLDSHKILQIMCAGEGDPGPVLKSKIIAKYAGKKADFYEYTTNKRYARENGSGNRGVEVSIKKKSIIYVPKAAYYPLYDGNKNVTQSYDFEDNNKRLNEIMKSIWKQLDLGKI